MRLCSHGSALPCLLQSPGQEAVSRTVARSQREAEPDGSSETEPTSAFTTRSGRVVVEPTRLDQDAAYVEHLGPLRDLREQLCKEPDHVTKDAQIEALTAEVIELHE